MQTVGILGGMGPDATVDLMRRIIALTPAQDDQDHLRMLVDNNPQVPSRMAALMEASGPSPAPVLIDMARSLEQQGVGFLAMPCNTAHHYYDEIASRVTIPFLNLPALATAHLARAETGLQRVGLLASSALRQIQLYEPWMEQSGFEVVYPQVSRQDDLMSLIKAVKAGSPSAQDIAAFQAAADDVVGAGAQALLIACTELSVIADQLRSSVNCYDAADLLARAVVEQAGAKA